MPYKLSLFSAIAINLNIMLGAGIFLNSIPLAKYAGGLGFMPYIIIGFLLIPLIIAMATLLNYHEEGTFYDVSKREIGPLFGFISSWTYFVAKPASAALMIHFSTHLMQQLFPILQQVSSFTLDIIIIGIYVSLNLLNMKIGRAIQFSFLSIKTIPLLFIIFAGFWFFKFQNFASINLNLRGISMGLPLALFASSGFEATLSLSQHIQNSKQNAPRAIIFSYFFAIFIYIIYQLCYFAPLNLAYLTSIESFNGIAFFIQSIYTNMHTSLQALMYTCIAISALGGAYSIIFSNNWNLYTLAHNGHTFFPQLLTKKNQSGIAYWCLFTEISLCLIYILLTRANQIMLQQISAFGSSIAYTISIIAFILLAFKVIKKNWARFIAILALINCITLIAFCINGFINHGLSALYGFIIIQLFGLIMYMFMLKQVSQKRPT